MTLPTQPVTCQFYDQGGNPVAFATGSFKLDRRETYQGIISPEKFDFKADADGRVVVRYLNDGQREVVLHRPDATRKSAAVALVAGTRQTIPSDGLKLIDVVRNTGGTERSVRQVSREILDAQTPGWHGLTGVTEILHFVFDSRDPTAFYVYPPAASSGASVEALYAATPADVTEPADGALYTAVTGNISIPYIYGNALQDYIMFRAYSKDSEYAGNAARAQAYYALFANSLGIEVKATAAVAPTTQGNPNMARLAQQG